MNTERLIKLIEKRKIYKQSGITSKDILDEDDIDFLFNEIREYREWTSQIPILSTKLSAAYQYISPGDITFINALDPTGDFDGVSPHELLEDYRDRIDGLNADKDKLQKRLDAMIESNKNMSLWQFLKQWLTSSSPSGDPLSP